jgi:hypothetical protein
MENWRKFLIEDETFILTEGEQIKAQEFVDKIKMGLVAVAAKKASAEAWEQFKSEVGPEAAEAAMAWGATVPIIGNAVSGISAIWKTGKATAKAVLASAAVGKTALDVMKLTSKNYVGIEDNKIGKNPLAKLFNIDDKMEIPIAEDFLTNFAGLMLKYLQDNPDMLIDPDRFAEEALANYINNKNYLQKAQPPAGELAELSSGVIPDSTPLANLDSTKMLSNFLSHKHDKRTVTVPEEA